MLAHTQGGRWACRRAVTVQDSVHARGIAGARRVEARANDNAFVVLNEGPHNELAGMSAIERIAEQRPRSQELFATVRRRNLLRTVAFCLAVKARVHPTSWIPVVFVAC